MATTTTNHSRHLSTPILVAVVFAALLGAASASAPAATQLVRSVCNHTSNYTFCASALAADPRTPTADPYALSFVAFGLAYSNASATRHAVAELARKAGGEAGLLRRLERCRGGYEDAVSALEMAYNDLNSETFFELADLAGEASSGAEKCDAAFRGAKDRPLAARNAALKGLCEICAAVSKLFTGGF